MTTIQHTTKTYAPLFYKDEQLYYLAKHNLNYTPLSFYDFDNNYSYFMRESKDGEVYYSTRGKYYKLQSVLQSTTVADTPHLLITPDEVMRLPENKQIVFIKGISSICCDRPNYYDFRNLKEHSEIKPPHEIDFFEAILTNF